jgi:hypothetical protein
VAENNRRLVHDWLNVNEGDEYDRLWQNACGVIFRQNLIPKEWNTELQSVLSWPGQTTTSATTDAKVEVHSVRTTRRTGPDGQELYQLVVEVTQRRRGFLSADMQTAAETRMAEPAREDFLFRGGATLIFDLKSKKLRYAIRKSIANDARLAEQRIFLEANPAFRIRSRYDDVLGAVSLDEPFAFAHRGY